MSRQGPMDGSSSDKMEKKSHQGSLDASVRLYDKNNPFFRKPSEIGTFSQGDRGEFLSDKSALRYLSLPEKPGSPEFNLNSGYDSFISKDDSHEGSMDDLLRWVLLHRGDLRAPGEKNPNEGGKRPVPMDFVSWRGALTKVAGTPYENREGWVFAACKVGGTIYLAEFDTPERKQQRASQNDRQKLMSYWGYKFEQYTTSGSVGGQPVTSTPVNNNVGYGVVVSGQVDQHTMLYAGETDCVCPKSKEYVELKTSRTIENDRQRFSFERFKLLKWWLQSFLLAVPRIVCGFRDDDGSVKSLQEFKTLGIPELAAGKWKENVCLNFLQTFLGFVKQAVQLEGPEHVYVLLTWQPKGRVEVRRVSPSGEKRYHFLPDWFLQKIAQSPAPDGASALSS